MRSVCLTTLFVFLAAAVPAEAQLTIFSDVDTQYVNNEEGYVYTGGDDIEAAYSVAISNSDPQNSYTVYIYVEIDDSSGNPVGSATTSFTANAAVNNTTPTITNGGLSCSYEVPAIPNEDNMYTATCYVYYYVNGVRTNIGEPIEVWFHEG